MAAFGAFMIGGAVLMFGVGLFGLIRGLDLIKEAEVRERMWALQEQRIRSQGMQPAKPADWHDQMIKRGRFLVFQSISSFIIGVILILGLIIIGGQ